MRCHTLLCSQATGRWGESIPDMTLVGHEDQAQFPLATSRSRPMVASGKAALRHVYVLGHTGN
jgi:hypothetical protein